MAETRFPQNVSVEGSQIFDVKKEVCIFAEVQSGNFNGF